MLKVVGPPLKLAEWAPLFAHESVNQSTATSTALVKVTVIDASSATSLPLWAGVVSATSGHTPPLRGAGVAMAKSAKLSSVSVRPDCARKAASVLLRVAVGPLPSKSVAAEP